MTLPSESEDSIREDPTRLRDISVNVGGDVSGTVNVAGRDVNIFNSWPSSQDMLASLRDPSLPHSERLVIGILLNRGEGDPRPGLGFVSSVLPDLPSIRGVKLRRFWGRKATEIGTPDILWTPIKAKPGLYLSYYLVTYTQYREFFCSSHTTEQRFLFNNYPVNNVLWDDAIAFCNALNRRLGYDTFEPYASLDPKFSGIRLPSVEEWQLAAQTLFDIDPRTTNTYESGLDSPTAVGMYPIFPHLPQDLIGNLEEWCIEEPQADQYKPALGASWDAFHSTAHYGARYPKIKAAPHIGFRLAIYRPSEKAKSKKKTNSQQSNDSWTYRTSN